MHYMQPSSNLIFYNHKHVFVWTKIQRATKVIYWYKSFITMSENTRHLNCLVFFLIKYANLCSYSYTLRHTYKNTTFKIWCPKILRYMTTPHSWLSHEFTSGLCTDWWASVCAPPLQVATWVEACHHLEIWNITSTKQSKSTLLSFKQISHILKKHSYIYGILNLPTCCLVPGWDKRRWLCSHQEADLWSSGCFLFFECVSM